MIPQLRPNFLVINMDDVPSFFFGFNHTTNPQNGDPQIGEFDAFNQGQNADGLNLYADTPVLDRLVRRGLNFVNGYAQPVCSNDRCSLYLGQYPSSSGFGGLARQGESAGTPLWDLRNVASTPTMFETFSNAGYRTGIVGKWHLHAYDSFTYGTDPGTSSLPWDRIPEDGGFDYMAITYHNLQANEGPRPTAGGVGDNYNYYTGTWSRGDANVTVDATSAPGDVHANGTFALERQFADAQSFIENTTTKPWLMVISTNAGHSPWDRPHPTSKVNTPGDYILPGTEDATHRWGNNMATLEWLDTRLGEMLAALDSDVVKRTVIVFTSDNGAPPAILSTGINDRGKDYGATIDALLAAPENRFKNAGFEPGIRVPFVFSGPGIRPALRGTETKALIQSCDIFPTLCGLANITPPAGVDGIDQTPVLRGESAEVRDQVVIQEFSPNGDPTAILGDAEAGADGNNLLYGFSKRYTDSGTPTQNGRFKIVRNYTGSTGSTQEFTDYFYRLEDGNGDPVDLYEQTPLDTGPAEEYEARYNEAIADLEAVLP